MILKLALGISRLKYTYRVKVTGNSAEYIMNHISQRESYTSQFIKNFITRKYTDTLITKTLANILKVTLYDISRK